MPIGLRPGTLHGAIDDGAIAIRIPEHAKKELEAYLDCGLLCRGFARLRCESCDESRLVAFSCKGRGFRPSCLGRRMCATAANLFEDVRLRFADHAVAFSPDGQRIVAATNDMAVRVWTDLEELRGVDDPKLWAATTHCMPIDRRMDLLRVPEATAGASREACLRRVEEVRVAAAGP